MEYFGIFCSLSNFKYVSKDMPNYASAFTEKKKKKKKTRQTNRQLTRRQMNKRGKFLKTLWCWVGGRV